MKYVVITGASSGIGKEIAIKFASEKYNLIIVARRKELLDNLKKELEDKYKIKVLVYVYDLSISENVYKFYQQIKQNDINLLVNNAGFGDEAKPWDTDLKKAEQMIDLNIKALTILTTLFIKDNLEKESQIINVSSVAGYMAWGRESIYSATKFYVSVYSEIITKILKKSKAKLKVKVLAPSITKTEFAEVAVLNANIEKENKKTLIEIFNSKGKDPQKLAEYTWKLYNSKKTVGIVHPVFKKFILRKRLRKIWM
ncbi:Serine 3-dehydrogenase [Candidatus Hepatoplasma crinochetorum Av]|uniref:Serine 3-dehydrogenase n=1 Tax=Candidatus Hepatoplasma crinochetorum Av TaxID=1427984 RepID=W8GFG2_9MOLU|nr:SDR family NAD(P)-dependent oxidoreductase [Candidatus Hepatoplasma crinochetorum]AHK22338.1 Serine 3-dehydrogenase [Candidatus Hepatoplasma crinochetorum Av]